MSLESVRAWLADMRPISADRGRGEHRDRRRPRPRRSASRRAGSPRRWRSASSERVFLLVARGDARLDNPKTKAAFGGRPRMLGPEETLALTGHPVGGVCPFGLARRCPSISTSRCAISTGLSRRRLAQQLGRGRAGAALELVGNDWVDSAACRTWPRAPPRRPCPCSSPWDRGGAAIRPRRRAWSR